MDRTQTITGCNDCPFASCENGAVDVCNLTLQYIEDYDDGGYPDATCPLTDGMFTVSLKTDKP